MFSPSLVSMMLHSMGPDTRFSLTPPSVPTRFKSITDVAASLYDVANLPGGEWPEIPVVGWTTRHRSELEEWFESSVVVAGGEPATYFWGRISLKILLRFFLQFCDRPRSQEYIDLGTPIREAGAGSVYDKKCATLLRTRLASRPLRSAPRLLIWEKTLKPPRTTTGVSFAMLSLPGSSCLTMLSRFFRFCWNG